MEKKKKPEFRRQEAHIRQRLERSSWRRPLGKHSKIRKRRAGKMKRPSVGYKNPAAIRGLTRNRKVIVRISNSKNIALEKNQVAVLSSSIGRKKRLEILEAAKKAEISFLNIKNVADAILKIKNEIEKQKLEKKARLEAKKKKKAKKEEKKKEEKVEKLKEEAKQEIEKPKEEKVEEKKEIKEEVKPRIEEKVKKEIKPEIKEEVKAEEKIEAKKEEIKKKSKEKKVKPKAKSKKGKLNETNLTEKTSS